MARIIFVRYRAYYALLLPSAPWTLCIPLLGKPTDVIHPSVVERRTNDIDLYVLDSI